MGAGDNTKRRYSRLPIHLALFLFLFLMMRQKGRYMPFCRPIMPSLGPNPMLHRAAAV